MVAMYDRKIKYFAYISRLQSNQLNHGIEMRFCKKKSSTLSKFLLKTFSALTNSENLRFFFYFYYATYVMWLMTETCDRIKSEIKKIKQYFWLPP